MEAVVGIIIGLAILGGLYYFKFRKKKQQPEQKEIKGFKDYQLKVANLTAKGMEENRDFITAIISISEFKSKTPQQIEDWIKEKVGKEGTLSNYDAVLGLQELTYTTTDKTIDVFFLIVEKTSQNVIDWKEPKPEEKNVYYIHLDPNPDVDNTVSFQEQLNAIPDGVMITDYPKTASFVSSVIGDKWMESFFISTRLGNVKYVNIILPKGEYRMEGDEVYRHLQDDGIVTMWHRKHLLFQGESATEKTVLYTTAPATPYGGVVQQNKYSYRRQLWLRYCDDIELFNIKLRGPNVIDGRKIGMTEENTPSFWYQSYDKGEHVPYWYLYKHEQRLIGDREVPVFQAPEELDENVKDIFVEKLYTEFLKAGIPEGEMVPAAADTGSISGSSAYRGDWEQEHAVDLRDSTRIRLYNFDVLGPFGDAVYIGGCKDIHIHHCHFKFMGRQGVAICNNVDNVLIEYVVTELGRRADYDFEPDLTQYYVRGVEVRYCDMSSAQTKFAANGRGDVSNIYIHDNKFTGSGHFIICYDSLLRTKRQNWRVENNTRTGGFGSPIADIRFGLTDNIILKGNNTKVGATQSRKSAEFTNCQNVQIIENDFGYGEFIDNTNSEIIMEGNTPEQKLL